MSSILTSVKELLGIPEAVTDFDAQLVMYINMAFGVLAQIGVGETPYSITLTTGDLEEFLPDAPEAHGLVIMYLFTKVRLLFDPPASSFVLTALESSIKELEWRLVDQTAPVV